MYFLMISQFDPPGRNFPIIHFVIMYCYAGQTIVFSDRAFTCDVKSHKQSSLCTLGEAFLVCDLVWLTLWVHVSLCSLTRILCLKYAL